jgi:galactokinase
LAVVSAEIVKAFREHFGALSAPAIYRAPGRVNLIGEHTDYNLGYVLPIALEMACYVAAGPNADGELRIFSQDFDAEFVLPISKLAEAAPAGAWHDYAIGVAQQLAAAGYPVNPTNLLIRSEVPVGSGLSSSASLEVATAIALLGDHRIEPLALAQLAQRAEREFVGMPCGIMDQYASVFGRQGSAIQIDCRSLKHEYVTLTENVRVIAVNSMVKHELGSSAYSQRVAECAEAVAAMKKIDDSIESLRDVSLEFFTRVQEEIPPIPRQRARHVVTDNQRVLDFAAAAKVGDLQELGRLFVASHRSMQFDYEISCEEIDFLVDTAIRIAGVYGARMTGGGFGGCTVNLVEPEAVERFERELSGQYRQKFNIEPAFYDCQPAAGAGRLKIA